MATYKSKYEDEINALKSKIDSSPGFSYSPESDPAYRMYEKQYNAEALAGMKNTLAEAAALTGGYDNSYAQTAAQQEYMRTAGKLNDVIPELYKAAYERYKDDRSYDSERLDYLAKLDSEDYSRWRDSQDEALKLYLSDEENKLRRELAYNDNELEKELRYAELERLINKDAADRELELADQQLERDKQALEREKQNSLNERYSADSELKTRKQDHEESLSGRRYLLDLLKLAFEREKSNKNYEIQMNKNQTNKNYYNKY